MRTNLFLVLLLYGCVPCDDPIVLDNGPLPDSILAMVPYADGNVYSLQHSNGQIINFASTRFSETEVEDCHYCCDHTISYEINSTKLTPDYPVFSIDFWLSNADTIQYGFSCNVGKYFLNIPVHKHQYSVFLDYADSIQIGSTYYYDVFRIKPYNHNLYNEPIKVDSVYYNRTEGIIFIKMSNEEYYSIID
ncbi:MAG: hypothetical protein IH597_09255 [Bacteroidales bacterium]|nr:hypothetical protein [Bacteroidales bacterium]